MNDNTLLRNTWIGVGTKIGGGLIAAGVESTTGIVFNASNPQWCRPFTIESIRLQAGVGGGIGTSVVLFFNTPSIFTIDQLEIKDWSVNLSLGPNWTAVVKNLTKMGFFGKAIKARGAIKSASKIENLRKTTILGKLNGDDLSGLRDGASYLYSARDIASRGNKPTIVALDVPFGSFGAEIAICPIIMGKLSILDF